MADRFLNQSLAAPAPAPAPAALAPAAPAANYMLWTISVLRGVHCRCWVMISTRL